MSVMIVSDETYIRMYQKMKSYQSRKVVDENYCNTLALSDKECKEVILTWRFLNLYSYDKRYNKQSDYELADKSLSEKLDSAPTDEKAMSIYEMLKAMECVKYQIEVDTTQNQWWKKCMHYLDKAIAELSGRIIGSLPEYKAARWG